MARILVVDDDPDLREVVELVLSGAGHTVDSVSSGRAALECLAERAYNLVVCDLSMPDLDGTVVGGAIANQPPPRPAVIFITGFAGAGPYEEFIRSTHAPILTKPFDIEALRQLVRHLLGGI